MPYNTITQVFQTGNFVNAEHFSGNALYTRNTDNGTPHDEFIEAVTELDMPGLRYPAGHPDVAYADGLLINGALPDHLVAFLEASRDNNLQVVIVTPTLGAYSGPAEMEEFARLLVEEYGDVVHAFEIGNEYWNHQSEAEYGQIANESIIAINTALEDQQVEIDIWVQMGDAGGQMSSFNGVEGSWTSRNVSANEAIIAQLGDEARSIIDGVVEHYYFRIAQQDISYLTDADQLIGLDFSIWQSYLNEDITLNITEWNIRSTNYFQLGMRAASTVIAQVQFLIDLEVDEMYVWPPQHNTSSDLAGANGVLYDPITGIVINSVGGAVFDLMSSSLVGMESIEIAEQSDSGLVSSHVYANDDQVIVYVTSRSNQTEDITFSLGDFWFGASLNSAIQIGYDESSSDGQYYHYGSNTWVQADHVVVDGQNYFLNEHDVNAAVTQHEVDDLISGNDVVFELRPYEVIELIFDLPSGEVISGTDTADRLDGTSADEIILGYGGDDVITGGDGSDIINGGDGGDFINSGAGNDLADGGAGDDTLRGWGGSDTLVGGAGDDNIDGWFGNDSLDGGLGNDTLIGGNGNDHLNGGFGSDLIEAGEGDDIITYNSGADLLIGNEGADTFQFSSSEVYGDNLIAFNVSAAFQTGTGQIVQVEGMNRFNAVTMGGEGVDRIVLTETDDALFLHDDFSAFHESFGGTNGGVDQVARISGIEIIDGGDGNDLLDMTSPEYSLFGTEMELIGGLGDDTIWASDADDVIHGGAGDDVLFGGAGNNTIYGGSGADSFQITQSSFDTVIADFDPFSGDTLEIFQNADFFFSGVEMDSETRVLNLLFSNSDGYSVGNLSISVERDIFDEIIGNNQITDEMIFIF